MKHCAGKSSRWIKWILLLGIIAVIIMFIFVQPLSHYRLQAGQSQPEEEISQLLDKKRFSDEDYQSLFCQTGLGKCTVDKLRASDDYSKGDILKFQKAYLNKSETECKKTSIVTKQDRVVDWEENGTSLAPVEDGDILVSFSSHTFGWRHGHAGIVVDAEAGTCLEAIVVGCDSEFTKLKQWKRYSSFAILRLKGASLEERHAIAAYAEKNLCDIPYSLTSGVFGEKAPTDGNKLTAQCAYLIWYAYAHFGYDLDSDGGRLVTVKDIAESPKLKAVQIFGMDASRFDYD